MAVFLPFIAELGALVTSELITLGVGETLATAAGGFVTNEARKKANQVTSDTFDALGNKILGPERKAELEDIAGRAPSEIYGLLSDPREFAKRRLDEQKKRQETIDRELSHDLSGKNPGQHPEVDGCRCDDESEIPMGIPFATTDSPGNMGGLIAGLIVEHSSELADAGIQDHLVGIIPELEMPEPTSSHEEILDNLTKNDPQKYSIIQRLSNFYADKSLSKSEEFKEIYRKYTGKGFEPRNVVMSEDRENYLFYMYDELGDLVSLKQNKNAKTLPAVYGVFGGPMSPNNRLPTDPPDGGGVPDVCFLAHDADYSKSYFHWESDMRLVSRLVQRRESWPQDKAALLNSIVIYFSTVGASLAIVKGSIVGDPSVGVIEDDVTDDLFPVAVPEAVNLPKDEYLRERFNFYKQFSEGIQESETETKIFSTGGKRVRNLFESIKIELL